MTQVWKKSLRKDNNIQSQRWMSRRKEMQNWRDKHAAVSFFERKVVQYYPSTPFSIRTADAGGHESVMPGSKPRFLLLPAYETRVWGARAHKETPEDPSPRTSAPTRGWARSWFTYSFYLWSPSPHKEYNISIEVIGGQSSRVMYIRFHWLLYHIVESILVDLDRSPQQPDNACED